MWELTKSFRFEAAHALSGTTFGAASEEIHGHSFRTEVTVRGTPDPATGMVLDLGLLERRMAEVQKLLDHKLLNRIEAIGPPTLENLSRFIWERVQHAGNVTRVSVTATVATKAVRITDRRLDRHLRSNPCLHKWPDGLLRGACHRAALRADPVARNDEG